LMEPMSFMIRCRQARIIYSQPTEIMTDTQ
jgi:hypothetical protein